MSVEEQIDELLSDPMALKRYKPFTRGVKMKIGRSQLAKDVGINEVIDAQIPQIQKHVISQDEFLRELDPSSHKVLFDQNIPSITMKNQDQNYIEIEYKKMAVPYQRLIRNKQVLHLCGNPTQFTLMNTNPTEKQNELFVTYKQYWDLRNMDGMRTKMISTQKSVGISGMLFYFDYKGRVKARLLSYEDGFILCPHNDQNGDRILESVYYKSGDNEYIDSYDDTYLYRYVYSNNEDNADFGNWRMLPPVAHGFSEIPLITKRGNVAWDNVQSLIEVYEIIYNIFLVIQKRHGWGILYVRGQFRELGKQIAGAIVLNDTSTGQEGGSADFKQAPSPQNMIDTLGLLEETIQKGSGCTFLLPKDVKSSGDISAQAIMLTQSLDIETALQGCIDWQNVIDKQARLFKEGLAKELVNHGVNPNAITDFEDIRIRAKLKVWRPQNDSEYNSMIIQLKQSGCISEETAIENNTESSPDEKIRRQKEREAEEQRQRELSNNTNNNNNNNL